MAPRLRLAVFHNLPHGGGARRAMTELCARLSAAHELDLFTVSSAEHGLFSLAPWVKRIFVYEEPPPPQHGRPLGFLNGASPIRQQQRAARLGRQIAADVDARDYDIVFAHHCQLTHGPALLPHLRTPSVYLCHEPLRTSYEPLLESRSAPAPRRYRLRGAVHDALLRRSRRAQRNFDAHCAKAATVLLANSYYSREALFRTYGRFARVLYLGVDVGRFRPLGLSRENCVLSVGMLVPHKGHDLVIESLARLPAGIRPRLEIIAPAEVPGEADYLRELAARRGVSLDLHRGISDEELVVHYNRARLCIYAPVMEPFGLVPLEAMACATPVVGVREAGLRETVISGETGLLVERDAGELASAVETLLRDRSTAEAMGRAGRRWVAAHWSWDRAAHDLIRLFHSTVRDGGSDGAVNPHRKLEYARLSGALPAVDSPGA